MERLSQWNSLKISLQAVDFQENIMDNILQNASNTKEAVKLIENNEIILMESNKAAMKAREGAKKAREEAKKAREEAIEAREAAKNAREEAIKAREAAKKAREEAKKAREEAEKAREEAEKGREEAKKAREESKKAREEAKKVREAALRVNTRRQISPREMSPQLLQISEQLADHEEGKEVDQSLPSDQLNVNYNFSDRFNYSKGISERNKQKPRKIDYQIGMAPDLCAICIEKFTINEAIFGLPRNHLFHQNCIMGWLSRKTKCPLCNLNL
ncbi:unnamed protein product [Blepharisma stoltei]|uniref:RING-type domain-containing protein n=1 Tax=Blepharisma stoltei TaxID=1481888 RepID=A0AAU9JJ18_9CILI|nr:unnamed protein product [Blepharisma stoltei]